MCSFSSRTGSFDCSRERPDCCCFTRRSSCTRTLKDRYRIASKSGGFAWTTRAGQRPPGRPRSSRRSRRLQTVSSTGSSARGSYRSAPPLFGLSYFQDPGGWISYLGFTLSFTASAIVGATWGAMALSLSTLPLSVLCDFGVVAVERRLMRRGAALDSAVTIVTILAINAAIVIVVLSVPLIVNALL